MSAPRPKPGREDLPGRDRRSAGAQFLCAGLAAVALLFVPARALAWGCEGHLLVALIAERHLRPHAREVAREILERVPIDRTLKRFCRVSGLDAFADASTWADDYRHVNPDTAPWHYLDIPRGSGPGDLLQYCPAAGCVTRAITGEVALLRRASAPPEERAAALRFLIHFVGDVHQPLHATNNHDRGGNCVPVQYYGRSPRERVLGSGDYHPNLHALWDTDILGRMMGGTSAQDFAAALDREFSARATVWQGAPRDPLAWAWESHEFAERVAYGRLRPKIPVEAPRPLDSCDDSGVAGRMLRFHEVVSAPYEAAAQEVIREQLAKAGVRLAAVLNDLWP